MPLSELVGPHLPYLRRFARCLSGSQEGGDAHVVATLQTLLADPQILSRDTEPRVGLYRVLLAVWKPDQAGSADGAANHNLAALTPRSRQAFLLISVEGFSIKQVAEILLTDTANVSRLIDQAGREIAEQLATDILIIEDEPLIAIDLAKLVQSLGHRVSGTARTRDEAVAAAQLNRPGLVLADIQLADDSSGVDAVHDILSSIDVPVVFITAHPERLLTGKRPEPSFLITKPYHEDMVKAVISQALFFDMRAGDRAGTRAASA